MTSPSSPHSRVTARHGRNPWFSEAPNIERAPERFPRAGQPTGLGIEDSREKPNFLEIGAAALRVDFLGGNLRERMQLAYARDAAEEEERVDLWNEETFKKYPYLNTPIGRRRMAGARTEYEAYWLNRILQQEHEDRALLDSEGWGGVFARLAAGVISPENLIPMGYFFKGAKTVGQFSRAGMKSAVVGVGIGEAGLQATQLSRPFEETAAAMLVAPILGGALGGVAGAGTVLAKKMQTKMIRDLLEQGYRDSIGAVSELEIRPRITDIATQLGVELRKIKQQARAVQWREGAGAIKEFTGQVRERLLAESKNLKETFRETREFQALKTDIADGIRAWDPGGMLKKLPEPERIKTIELTRKRIGEEEVEFRTAFGERATTFIDRLDTINRTFTNVDVRSWDPNNARRINEQTKLLIDIGKTESPDFVEAATQIVRGKNSLDAATEAAEKLSAQAAAKPLKDRIQEDIRTLTGDLAVREAQENARATGEQQPLPAKQQAAWAKETLDIEAKVAKLEADLEVQVQPPKPVETEQPYIDPNADVKARAASIREVQDLQVRYAQGNADADAHAAAAHNEAMVSVYEKETRADTLDNEVGTHQEADAKLVGNGEHTATQAGEAAYNAIEEAAEARGEARSAREYSGDTARSLQTGVALRLREDLLLAVEIRNDLAEFGKELEARWWLLTEAELIAKRRAASEGEAEFIEHIQIENRLVELRQELEELTAKNDRDKVIQDQFIEEKGRILHEAEGKFQYPGTVKDGQTKAAKEERYENVEKLLSYWDQVENTPEKHWDLGEIRNNLEAHIPNLDTEIPREAALLDSINQIPARHDAYLEGAGKQTDVQKRRAEIEDANRWAHGALTEPELTGATTPRTEVERLMAPLPQPIRDWVLTGDVPEGGIKAGDEASEVATTTPIKVRGKELEFQRKKWYAKRGWNGKMQTYFRLHADLVKLYARTDPKKPAKTKIFHAILGWPAKFEFWKKRKSKARSLAEVKLGILEKWKAETGQPSHGFETQPLSTLVKDDSFVDPRLGNSDAWAGLRILINGTDEGYILDAKTGIEGQITYFNKQAHGLRFTNFRDSFYTNIRTFRGYGLLHKSQI